MWVTYKAENGNEYLVNMDAIRNMVYNKKENVTYFEYIGCTATYKCQGNLIEDTKKCLISNCKSVYRIGD